MTGAQASRLQTSQRRVKKFRLHSTLNLIKAFRRAFHAHGKRDACDPVRESPRSRQFSFQSKEISMHIEQL